MRTGRAICLLVIFFIVISIVYVHNEQYSIRQPLDVSSKEYYSSGPIGYFKEKVRQHWGSDSTHYRTPGKVIMGKMGNETLRAELGRAAWHVIHTVAGKFPYYPTDEEKIALIDFIYLFARLYPCGQCAQHFQEVLKTNPPDTTSRDTISQWACTVHNIVNERLQKPQFDCSKVGDRWKCGCAEAEEEEQQQTETNQGLQISEQTTNGMTNTSSSSSSLETLKKRSYTTEPHQDENHSWKSVVNETDFPKLFDM